MLLTRSAVRLAVMSAALLLTACTTWVQEGKSKHDLEKDLSSCTVEGYSRFPEQKETYLINAPREEIVNKCTRSADGLKSECRQSTVMHPAQYGTRDNNASARNAAIRSCMMGLGWRQE